MMLTMSSLLRFLVVGATASSVLAFHLVEPVGNSFNPDTTTRASRTTRLFLTEDMIPEEASLARAYAVFWFFGASGTAGIGRSAFPRQFRRYFDAQKLKGVGPTKGGPLLGLPFPLIGYPEDVCIADVKQVIENPLSAQEIVDKFPIEGDLSAKLGYVTEQAFEQANSNANPLAVRAVFESLAVGTQIIQPVDAQPRLDRYKQMIQQEKGLNELKARLVFCKLVDYSGVGSLLFLLGLADILTFSDFYKGWFPDWPGGNNFPFSMFTDPDGSIFKIPDYWI